MIGIIGLPYAFNRAGLALGIVLLFALTGVVDWTIRYGFQIVLECGLRVG